MAWNRLTNVEYAFCSCRSNDKSKVVENTLSIATRIWSLNDRVFLSPSSSYVRNEIFLHDDLKCQMRDERVLTQVQCNLNIPDIEKVSHNLSSVFDMSGYGDFNWEIEFINRDVHAIHKNYDMRACNAFIRFTALCEQSRKFCSFYLDCTDDSLVQRIMLEMENRFRETCNIRFPSSLLLVWSNKSSKVLAKAVSVLLQDTYIHAKFPYSICTSLRSDFPIISLYREPSNLLIDDVGIPIRKLLVIDRGVPLAWDLALTRSNQLGVPVFGGQYCDEHLHFLQHNNFSLECLETSGTILKQEHISIEDAEYINYCVEKDLLLLKIKINNRWCLSSAPLTRLLSTLRVVNIEGRKYYTCKL